MRFSGLVSGILEITTTSAIRSAVITPTKMSRSRIISAMVDSIAVTPRSSNWARRSGSSAREKMALDPDIWGDNFLKQGGQPKISGPLGTSQHSLSYASQHYNEP